MRFILYQENQFCLLGKEYFREFDGKIFGTHNPYDAKSFTSKKKALEFGSRFESGKQEVGEYAEHTKLFDDCKYIYREIPLLDKKYDIPYTDQKPVEVLNWWMEIKKGSDKAVSQKNYSTWPSLYSIFKNLWEIRSYYDKGNTILHTATIFVTKDSEFKNFKKELYLVLDFSTYTKEGYKAFPIFDNDLSEFGTRYLLYKSDRDCIILTDRFGYDKRKLTLEESFKYIKDNYYYTF